MIINTKLMYGLYLLAPTKAQYQRRNAVQNKGLRKILNLKKTLIDRRNTVERIFQRANHILQTETNQEHRARTAHRKELHQKPTAKPKPPSIRSVTDEHQEQHRKYIGHLLREDHTTPTREATFNAAGQFNQRPKNRVGGMRKNGRKSDAKPSGRKRSLNISESQERRNSLTKTMMSPASIIVARATAWPWAASDKCPTLIGNYTAQGPTTFKHNAPGTYQRFALPFPWPRPWLPLRI